MRWGMNAALLCRMNSMIGKAYKFGSNLEELWEKLQKQETQSSTKWTIF